MGTRLRFLPKKDASPTLEYFEELCYNLYIFAKLCKNWSVYCDDISYDWILDSDLSILMILIFAIDISY